MMLAVCERPLMRINNALRGGFLGGWGAEWAREVREIESVNKMGKEGGKWCGGRYDGRKGRERKNPDQCYLFLLFVLAWLTVWPEIDFLQLTSCKSPGPGLVRPTGEGGGGGKLIRVWDNINRCSEKGERSERDNTTEIYTQIWERKERYSNKRMRETEHKIKTKRETKGKREQVREARGIKRQRLKEGK